MKLIRISTVAPFRKLVRTEDCDYKLSTFNPRILIVATLSRSCIAYCNFF